MLPTLGFAMSSGVYRSYGVA